MAVEVRGESLTRTIDEIARRKNMRAHYSVLPQGPVTATCAGLGLKRILRCLLGTDADLMFRNGDGAANTEAESWPAEFWILASSFAKNRADPAASCCPAGAALDSPPAGGVKPPEAESGLSEPERGRLFDLATDAEPRRRAEALSRLVTEGGPDDGTLGPVLEHALSDADAYVRTQALYGLARLEGEGALSHLRAAMGDGDASVRLMAVDAAGSDAGSVALLRQALADEDEVVGGLARAKLESLATASSP